MVFKYKLIKHGIVWNDCNLLRYDWLSLECFTLMDEVIILEFTLIISIFNVFGILSGLGKVLA